MNWQEESEKRNIEIDTIISVNNLTLEAEFIPFSQSRNKEEKDDRGNPQCSLNWFVTLKHKGKAVIRTDYMQGIGHIPKYSQGLIKASFYRQYLFEVCEKGKYYKGNQDRVDCVSFMHTNKLPSPDVKDVLYSLLMDSDVINCSSFEEWAGNFGYDTDSRKAESTYNACMKIALQLKNGLGNDLMEVLQESFQDY